MRKIVLLLVAVIGTISFSSAQKITAQNSASKYRHFSMAFNFGGGKHEGWKSYSFSWEPAWSFRNNKLGARIEVVESEMRNFDSYIATYERYLFNTDELRISLGGGLGHYNAQGAGGCGASFNPPGEDHVEHSMDHLGGMFRANIKFWHLQLGAEYNMVPPTIASNVTAKGETTSSVSHPNNYSTIYLGFVIGGGRKRPAK